MDWVYYFLLLLVLVAGLLINVFGAPGLWLMLAGVAGYAWVTHASYIAGRWLIALVVIALIAELLEFLSAGAAVKKAGGSFRGMIGAVIGGVLGGFFLTFLFPIPIVGTICGICAGTFLGAAVAELMIGKEFGHSTRVGIEAAKGRMVGTAIKLGFGILIMILALWRCFPYPYNSSAALVKVPAATTLPTTAPSTQGS
jgi:uncharacterized protein YqgC (DUF456 family)